MNNLKKHLLLLLVPTLLISCEKKDDTPTPIADFDFTIGENYEVTFNNKSQHAETYTWDFGDGKTSEDKNPTHTFVKGTYSIELTASNSAGVNKKTLNLLIESQEKASVVLNDPTNITNAGFDIGYKITDGRTLSSYNAFAQISDKEDFSNTIEVYEAISLNNTTSEKFIPIGRGIESLWFRNLVPNKTYFIRIKLRYTFNETEEDIFSETKTLTTLDMPEPTLELTNDDQCLLYFNVSSSLPNFNGNFTNNVDNKVTFSFNKEFTEIFEPEEVGYRFNSYYKEPSKTVYVKSTYTYNGVSKSVTKHIEFPDNFYDSEEWKGNNTLAYKDNNNNMLFDIIGDDGQRLVFHISNFKGVGAYKLKGYPEDLNNAMYAYYYPNASAPRHNLKELKDMPTLYIYKETNDAYYGRLGNKTDSELSMYFKDKDNNHESVWGMIFKAIKK